MNSDDRLLKKLKYKKSMKKLTKSNCVNLLIINV